jgi:hypothetical protein
VNCDHTLRGFLAVQLQKVGLESLDYGSQFVVSGIDRQRDLLGAAFHPRAQCPCRLDVEMARRRRKEHEADQVGTGVECGVKRLGRPQPADFDEEGHNSGGSSASSARNPTVCYLI